MAKTYNTFTNVATGDVYTAAQHNAILTNLAGYRVPPMCVVRRTSDQSPYTSYGDIDWQSTLVDTDGMWANVAASRITIQTAGMYLVNVHVYMTGAATITSGEVQVAVNGGGVMASGVPAYNTGALMCEMSGILALSVNDYLIARQGVTGGSAYVIKGAADRNTVQTRMSVTWLGQVS